MPSCGEHFLILYIILISCISLCVLIIFSTFVPFCLSFYCASAVLYFYGKALFFFAYWSLFAAGAKTPLGELTALPRHLGSTYAMT